MVTVYGESREIKFPNATGYQVTEHGNLQVVNESEEVALFGSWVGVSVGEQKPVKPGKPPKK